MESWEIVIELVKVVSPLIGSLTALSFSWAIIWKFFSRFTELSNRISNVEGKFEMLEKLVSLEELVRELRKLTKKSKKKLNNPGNTWVEDIVQIISVATGSLNLFFFTMAIIVLPEYRFSEITWGFFLIPGIVGTLPIYFERKDINGVVSLLCMFVALVPWFLAFIGFIISQLGI